MEQRVQSLATVIGCVYHLLTQQPAAEAAKASAEADNLPALEAEVSVSLNAMTLRYKRSCSWLRTVMV